MRLAGLSTDEVGKAWVVRRLCCVLPEDSRLPELGGTQELASGHLVGCDPKASRNSRLDHGHAVRGPEGDIVHLKNLIQSYPASGTACGDDDSGDQHHREALPALHIWRIAGPNEQEKSAALGVEPRCPHGYHGRGGPLFRDGTKDSTPGEGGLFVGMAARCQDGIHGRGARRSVPAQYAGRQVMILD